MDVVGGRAVLIILSEAEAAALRRDLRSAIRLGFTVRGNAPPDLLTRVARELRAAAGHADPQASVPDGPAGGRDPDRMRGSGQPDTTLSVPESARLAEVHARTVRKWIASGRVQARRGPRGAWRVDIASLAAWISQRRTEHDREAA